MQSVVGNIIDFAQLGFILDRQLLDNVSLANEIIKGYCRKYFNPRCMVKIDVKKAYDSLEWPFLESVVRALGFPSLFIRGL